MLGVNRFVLSFFGKTKNGSTKVLIVTLMMHNEVMKDEVINCEGTNDEMTYDEGTNDEMNFDV